MKQSLKEKRDSKFINLQKESAKYSRGMKSINSSKQASIDNLIAKPARVEPKQQRNIAANDSDINNQNSNYQSNQSNINDRSGSRNIISTKDSTDKENGLRISVGKMLHETYESSDEINTGDRIRGASISGKPARGFISNSLMKGIRSNISNISNISKFDASNDKAVSDRKASSDSFNSGHNKQMVNKEIIEINEHHVIKTVESAASRKTKGLKSKNSKVKITSDGLKSQTNIKARSGSLNKDHRSFLLKLDEGKSKATETGKKI